MSIGLDLTTCRFHSIRPLDAGLADRSCRACFVAVEKSPLHRQLLEQMQVTHAECDNHQLVWGDHALSFSRIFQAQSPCLPLLPEGTLPENQPPIRQMLAFLIEGLLPQSTTTGEICGVAFARSRHAARQTTIDFLTRLINLSGYRVSAISPAQALGLAEFAHCEFSGIALHIGSAVSDACVMHHGRIAWEQSLELADCLPESLYREFQSILLTAPGDEESLDDAAGADRERARMAIPLKGNESDIHATEILTRCQVLQQVMERHLGELISAGLFNASTPSMPLLLGGESPRGSVVAQGMKQDMQALSGPLPIGEVRWPMSGDRAVARGCLIHAELESSSIITPRVA